jgi:hypothetical protein
MGFQSTLNSLKSQVHFDFFLSVLWGNFVYEISFYLKQNEIKKEQFQKQKQHFKKKEKGTKEILEKYQILKNINIMKLV